MAMLNSLSQQQLMKRRTILGQSQVDCQAFAEVSVQPFPSQLLKSVLQKFEVFFLASANNKLRLVFERIDAMAMLNSLSQKQIMKRRTILGQSQVDCHVFAEVSVQPFPSQLLKSVLQKFEVFFLPFVHSHALLLEKAFFHFCFAYGNKN
jgi:5'(3')-deoxyribonucleotidase